MEVILRRTILTKDDNSALDFQDGEYAEENSVEETSAEESKLERIYTPKKDEPQLTFRAVAIGCIVGSVVACTNIYIGLKIGWTFGASIISAVLGYAVFTTFGQKLSVLETNITQTAGSAAGAMASAAGLVAAVPALTMLGYQLEWYSLMLWALSVAFLGVFFAVPLRRQLVEIDKLRFPTGTATAETILAMTSGNEAMMKAKILIFAALGAGGYALLCYFIHPLENPPFHKWLNEINWPAWLPVGATVATMAAWTFKIYLGPSLMGAGFLIGPRVVLSLVAGAIIAWGILGPIAKSQGWAPGPIGDYKTGVRGWLLWPGVALMVSEALTALLLSWKTFIRAFKMPTKTGDDPSKGKEHIPNSWWMSGLFMGSLLAVIISTTAFGIPWYFTLLAIVLSSVLAIVAVRSTGETDINPVGGMGKVTQLVFGGLAPGHTVTNLMGAAITGAGASQAADMMQDLKTGYLLGASPRKQFISQLWGICAGVIFVVPVYYIFTKAYTIGGKELPAPAAKAWKAMADLLAKGFEALPPNALPAIIAACIAGAMMQILRKTDLKLYVPSGLAMGIAFIIPAYYSLVMFYGLVIWYIWKVKSPETNKKYTFALASGLVAGEGLMGIVKAVLTILQVPVLIE